jgi:AbrB family looped-hinge helix DNA binding protein
MLMGSIQSKVTAQGQVSVPAEVRRQLGLGPGSVLVWEWHEGGFVVRRAGKSTSADIHQALFGTRAPAGKPVDVKAGVRKYVRRRHAGG